MKNKKILFGLVPILLIVLSCASRKTNYSDWMPITNYWRVLGNDTIVTPSKKFKVDDLVPILNLVPSSTIVITPSNDTITIGGFYMSQTEVTNSQYAFFLNNCKTLPEDIASYLGTDCKIRKVDNLYVVDELFKKHPVVGISYIGTTIYSQWLTEFYNKGLEADGLPPAPSYRLPSYMEFQLASLNEFASSPVETDKKNYSEPSPLGNYAWYKKNSASNVNEVKGKKENDLGLFDMKGNVSEWVEDVDIRKNELIYDLNPTNPLPDSASICGGSYKDDAEATKYLANTIVHKNTQNGQVGFRVCMTYMGRSSTYEF